MIADQFGINRRIVSIFLGHFYYPILKIVSINQSLVYIKQFTINEWYNNYTTLDIISKEMTHESLIPRYRSDLITGGLHDL
jgi:hypothetical protein